MKQYRFNKNRIVAFTVMALLVSSCGLMKKYEQPEFTENELYRGADSTQVDSTTIADLSWKEIFTDPTLQSLIEEALRENYDLKTAVSNMNTAAASLSSARGALFPNISANGSASHSKLSNTISAATGFNTEQYQLYGSASWEAPIWGKLRNAKKSAIADFLASEEYIKVVQTQLIATVATNYYALMALDKQLRITEETAENRRQYVLTVESLKEAGNLTGADIMQSVANRFSAEVSIPDLKQQIRELENAMSTLLGRQPGPIERAEIDGQEIDVDLKVGVPYQLLANRPDVAQAELQLRSAFYQVKVAKAYFYPSLTITATSGYSSTEISNLLNPTQFFYNLAAGLAQPIFNQNQNKARLKANEAAQDQALYSYKTTLLSAGEEVSNAMFSYEMAEEKMSIREKQLEALNNAVEFNEELLEFGDASYVDVLTSQTNLLSAQISSVDDKLQQMQAIVELYRALGGGWK